MDKYTVDLDQVLNDFEYSELTDQLHNRPKHSPHTNSFAKHSINNVFHSLNEYLNSDITPKASFSGAQPHSDNNKTGAPFLKQQPNQGDQDDRLPQTVEHRDESPASDALETSETRHETNESRESDLVTSVETCHEKNNCTNSDLLLSLESVHQNKELVTLENDKQLNEGLLVSLENEPVISLENPIQLNESTMETFASLENSFQINRDLVTSVETVQINEPHASDTFQSLEKESEINESLEKNCETIEDTSLDTIECSDVSLERTKVNNDEIVASLVNQSLETIECQSLENQLKTVKNNILSLESINTLVESADVSLENCDDDIKTIEGESLETVEKYDGSLDSDRKTNDDTKSVETVEILETSPSISSDDTQIIKNETKSLEIIESLEKPRPLKNRKKSKKSSDTNKTIENATKSLETIESLEKPKVSQPSEEIKTIENESPELENQTKEKPPSITIESESKTSEPIKVGFDCDVTLDESELASFLEEVEKELAPNEPKQESNGTRPSDLSLNNQAGDANKNVIDLVGAPGSTPYNNVYVNKELPRKQDAEETTASVSPTFSDISTETTSSATPSTDTANDEPVALVAAPPEATPPDLGTAPPIWIPDSDALNCQHCDTKFTVIKRRHHCRACGYVLCSKCCNLRHRLDYLDDVARVCNRCYDILTTPIYPRPQPNPNNPLEYCSTLPPHQQVHGSAHNPPSVLVPVGVLKRHGSAKNRTNKSVMFCDGIRPGSDLTNLDHDFAYTRGVAKSGRSLALIDPDTKCFMPGGGDTEALPPIVTVTKGDAIYTESTNGEELFEALKQKQIDFALQPNLLVHVQIVNMACCINKVAWCFATEGLINVAQDEIVLVLEVLEEEKSVPRDIFVHLNSIYVDAVRGTSIKEFGLSLHNPSNFLGSKNHAGFVYIRPTFQCLQNLVRPSEPFLIGILIHRWETPWAKLFPLRLVLRLGASYRYYPSPIISNRFRDSVYVEIGHTIINLLADFRNFTYTLPQISGLTIHMEDRNTTVSIPSNQYEQIMKLMNNSSDHILAFAGTFSVSADSHLVCIQDTQSDENAYSTHAINIHNLKRKVTGASFIVFNGALKSSSGLTAKSSIVEDGLMIQIPPEQMSIIRASLRNMKDYTIQCGCVNATSDETVHIKWTEPDSNFNFNVLSPIDGKSMHGIPSIRVHNAQDFTNVNRLIRWTEVFIMQNDSEATRNQDPIDVSKLSEAIAKAACVALVKYLDLLVSNSFFKVAIRANLSSFFVSYSVGSNGVKLPPIYMESLDNELVPVLHRNAPSDGDDTTIVIELFFRILRK